LSFGTCPAPTPPASIPLTSNFPLIQFSQLTRLLQSGRPNTTAAAIEPYPLLWIMKFSQQRQRIVDGFNEHDPWVELYNSAPPPLL